jgi:hypothetical protein
MENSYFIVIGTIGGGRAGWSLSRLISFLISAR